MATATGARTARGHTSLSSAHVYCERISRQLLCNVYLDSGGQLGQSFISNPSGHARELQDQHAREQQLCKAPCEVGSKFAGHAM